MTEEEMKEFVSSRMDSDLQFILADAGVELSSQVAIARRYGSVRRFNAIADDRAQVRTACLQDFAIGMGTPDERAQVASIVAAWEIAKDFSAKEVELRAEAKVLGQPRVLQTHERQAMLKAVELVYGNLNDGEAPSPDYLAVKAEETESNEPVAASLEEILSRKDTTHSQLQSTVDNAGHIKVTRTRNKGKIPTTTEEYRRTMKVAAYAWLCMAARYKAKSWLHGLELAHFTRFVEYILGERVLNIQVPMSTGENATKVKPDWQIVLAYELKLRREAMKLVSNKGYSLADALEAVTKDSDLKESYFTTPLALRAALGPSDPPPQNKYPRFHYKGNASKGNGKSQKGKGKSKGHFKEVHEKLKGLSLAWRTPDGRDLCFAWNSGSCGGGCGRVHQCRVKGCYGDHQAVRHKEAVGGA